MDRATDLQNSANRFKYCIDRNDGASSKVQELGTQAVKTARSLVYHKKKELNEQLMDFFRERATHGQ